MTEHGERFGIVWISQDWDSLQFLLQILDTKRNAVLVCFLKRGHFLGGIWYPVFTVAHQPPGMPSTVSPRGLVLFFC